MVKYHKIKTVWKRDPDNNYKTLLEGEWSRPEFELLRDIPWEATEKIDGTNIRVIWDESGITFGGRTEKAQLYGPLVKHLQNTFNVELFTRVFGEYDGTPITLYGEGYGARIQKVGTSYIKDGVDFVLFDIRIGTGLWLARESVYDIADQMGITRVPVILEATTLGEAIEFAEAGFHSQIAEQELTAEGLILRPVYELNDRLGRRIIAKIKYNDFRRG